MDVLKNIFNSADDGDRILVIFPDIYSFYSVSRWISEQFGDPIWILWTDAAVERINHMGKKYGFPTYGEAIVIGSRKDCIYLNVIKRYEVFEDFRETMMTVSSENRIIISFGINFLELFGYDISKAVELLIEHEKGIMCTCEIGKVSEKLILFHDVLIEISKSKNSYLSYRPYVARLKFAVEGGVAELSDVFSVEE